MNIPQKSKSSQYFQEFNISTHHRNANQNFEMPFHPKLNVYHQEKNDKKHWRGCRKDRLTHYW